MASYRTEEFVDLLERSFAADFALSESGALTSIAISLKRIADFCEDLRGCIREDGSFSVRP